MINQLKDFGICNCFLSFPGLPTAAFAEINFFSGIVIWRIRARLSIKFNDKKSRKKTSKFYHRRSMRSLARSCDKTHEKDANHLNAVLS